MILSRNDPVSGLRVFRSVKGADLGIERAVFTRGRSPYAYLAPLKANLFLSANAEDVRAALAAGFPAAHVYLESNLVDSHPDEVRIAFDGDAVLFADEAERVYQAQGLSAFQSHEADRATRPLPPGPFKPLLEALHRLQIADDTNKVPMKLRTALVTARSAPAHERAIRTLMDWDIDVDEAMFLGGMEKGPFLREFEPDFYFDDQTRHVRSAGEHVPSGHVLARDLERVGSSRSRETRVDYPPSRSEDISALPKERTAARRRPCSLRSSPGLPATRASR